MYKIVYIKQNQHTPHISQRFPLSTYDIKGINMEASSFLFLCHSIYNLTVRLTACIFCVYSFRFSLFILFLRLWEILNLSKKIPKTLSIHNHNAVKESDCIKCDLIISAIKKIELIKHLLDLPFKFIQPTLERFSFITSSNIIYNIPYTQPGMVCTSKCFVFILSEAYKRFTFEMVAAMCTALQITLNPYSHPVQ